MASTPPMLSVGSSFSLFFRYLIRDVSVDDQLTDNFMHHQYCWFASCIYGLFNLIDWSTHTIVLFANFIDVAISVSYFLSSHTFASLHTCSLTSYLFLPLHLSHLFTCLMHRQSVICLSFFRKATYIMCPPSVHLCIAYAIRLSFLVRFVLVSLESCLRICVLHASYHNPSQLSHTSYHAVPLIHWLFRKTLVSSPPPPRQSYEYVRVLAPQWSMIWSAHFFRRRRLTIDLEVYDFETTLFGEAVPRC